MNTTITAADEAAARETLIEANRQRNLNTPYEGKVWFTKERDDYGRTIRVIKSQQDGVVTRRGVVVCVPRWTEDLRTTYGMERYFTNDWVKGEELRKAGEKQDEAITQHRTLKTALAQFGCGSKEYELYAL